MTAHSIYTTAPERYDYGYTEQLFANVGLFQGKPVRLVRVNRDTPDQGLRYMSGLYFTRDQVGWNAEVDGGYIDQEGKT